MGNFFVGKMKMNQQEMAERQLQMQFQMQKRTMAMQRAGSRDFFKWIASFSTIATVGLLAGFRKTKKPGLIAPLLPLTFLNLYNYDLAYGNKVYRIRAEAEHIMNNEADALELPCGLPTWASISQGITNDEDTPSSASN